MIYSVLTKLRMVEHKWSKNDYFFVIFRLKKYKKLLEVHAISIPVQNMLKFHKDRLYNFGETTGTPPKKNNFEKNAFLL